MAVNASARRYRIWVCKPGEDESSGLEVTPYCSGDSSGFLTLTSNPINAESGLITASGRLVLQVPLFDDIYNPWENPDRWAIGNQVIVKVADTSGTLRYPPINRLQILSEPKPPYPGSPILEIELGCQLSQNDSSKAKRFNQVNTTQSRGAAISLLLAQLELNFDGSVAGSLTNYQPDTSKTAIEQAGELAIGGSSVLHQNREGAVTATPINFTPQYRLFKHRVGIDDADDYEPIQSPLRPASEVEVLSTKSAAKEQSQSDDSPERGFEITTETLSRSAVIEGESGAEFVSSIKTERWSWQGARYHNTVDEQRARGLCVSEDLYEFLAKQGRDIVPISAFALIPGYTCEENKKYESSKSGRLLKVTTEITKTRGEALAEYYKKNLLPNAVTPPLVVPFLAERVTVEYDYQRDDYNGKSDAGGQVRQIKTIRELPKGQIAAAANDWIRPGIGGSTTAGGETDLVIAEITIETWRKRGKDEWVHSIKQYQAGRVRNGTISAFLAFRKVKDSTTVSRAGQVQPPAAERRKATRGGSGGVSLSTPQRGSVHFAKTAKRNRQVQIQHTESESQAARIAEIIGKLDHYRHRGFRITTALRDEWFYWQPLSRIDLDYNGFTYWGVTDTVTLSLAGNQAIVVADCMRIGRTPAADTYPYPALAALTPAAPDPAPLSNLGSSSQPFINAVQTLYTVTETLEFEDAVTALIVSPVVAVAGTVIETIDTSDGVFEQVIETIETGDTASLAAPPVGEPTYSYWKLDSETNGIWIDQTSNVRHLQRANSPDPYDPFTLEYDSDSSAYCVEFHEYGSGSLQRTDTILGLATEDSIWSFALQFDLKLLLNGFDQQQGGYICVVSDQLAVFVQASGLNATLAFWLYDLNRPSSDYANKLTTPLSSPNVWNAISCEYDATAKVMRIKINGTTVNLLTVAPSDGNVPYAPNPALVIGDSSVTSSEVIDPGSYFGGEPSRFRLKEVKLYQNALIARS